MTLVLGAAADDIGFLISDTLLSFEFELKGHVGPVNGEFHALKIQILDGNTAVAFAGDVSAAVCLINEVKGALSTDQTLAVPEFLADAYRRIINATTDGSGPQCEFLVLQLTEAGKRLAAVDDHGVRYCDRAYIGDAKEYRQLTECRRSRNYPSIKSVQRPDGTFAAEILKVTNGEKEFDEISDAMEVLASRRSASVGAIAGCVIRVVNARISRQLEYLQAVEASISHAEGHSGYSLLASNTGQRGIGIYYRSGGVGFVLVVGDSELCHREHAGTLGEFIALGTTKYGLNLTGGTWAEI